MFQLRLCIWVADTCFGISFNFLIEVMLVSSIELGSPSSLPERSVAWELLVLYMLEGVRRATFVYR